MSVTSVIFLGFVGVRKLIHEKAVVPFGFESGLLDSLANVHLDHAPPELFDVINFDLFDRVRHLRKAIKQENKARTTAMNLTPICLAMYASEQAVFPLDAS
jgi:hypothetical protein